MAPCSGGCCPLLTARWCLPAPIADMCARGSRHVLGLQYHHRLLASHATAACSNHTNHWEACSCRHAACYCLFGLKAHRWATCMLLKTGAMLAQHGQRSTRLCSLRGFNALAMGVCISGTTICFSLGPMAVTMHHLAGNHSHPPALLQIPYLNRRRGADNLQCASPNTPSSKWFATSRQQPAAPAAAPAFWQQHWHALSLLEQCSSAIRN